MVFAKFNAKINEFDTEIEDLKRISGTTVTKQTLLDFIKTNKKAIEDAIQGLQGRLNDLRNTIANKLSNYYTKANSNDLFASSSTADNYLR